jgi:hypothetical protein
MVELAAGKACFHPRLLRGRTTTLTADALFREMAVAAMALLAAAQFATSMPRTR